MIKLLLSKGNPLKPNLKIPYSYNVSVTATDFYRITMNGMWETSDVAVPVSSAVCLETILSAGQLCRTNLLHSRLLHPSVLSVFKHHTRSNGTRGLIALAVSAIHVKRWSVTDHTSSVFAQNLPSLDSRLLQLQELTRKKPIPVAARSKAYVFGRSPAEIVGSNTTGSMDVCLLWVLCVVR